MSLSKVIMEYAMKQGQFSTREICLYCFSDEVKINVKSKAAVSGCLRRLKGKGFLWNIRGTWYFRRESLYK
ncbi:hypothetical protein ACUIJN_06555 [Metabacillus halosaccharovorans]|uniref:hypothetical protein n=1 Tax=Metabacillus halosaccharovorans TaxID=930124 RepID=UPI00403D5FB6